MQVSIQSLSEVQQEADIEVSSEELRPLFEEAYQRYRPKAQLKGFRKGKVPLAMVKQLYGEAIEQDALDTIADDFYKKAMAEKDIRPLGQPALIDMDYKRGEHFRFKIKYEIRPTFKLKSYRGIAVEKPVHTLTDAEVNAEIDHLQRINSTTADATAVTDENHIVTGDLQELDAAGVPLIGKKTPRARFFLWDQTLAPEIREALRNAESGATYRASFDSGQGEHKHKVHVAITVTKIEKVTLPPFDDELVRKITSGKVTTTEEFLKNLRADLGRYWEEQAESAVANSLADEVVRSHEFPVPESIVEAFLDSFVDDVRTRSKDKKLPADFDEQKFRAENRSYAIWQAKWLLLRERIAEEEHIAVSDEELDQMAERDAARTGIEKDRLQQYYRSSRSTSDRVLSDKIVAFLRANAKIKEKPVA